MDTPAATWRRSTPPLALRDVSRFARLAHRDRVIQQQLAATRSLFGVAVVAQKAGFAITPRGLLLHQALWGGTWVGGYRRQRWRELLLPLDISTLRLLNLDLRPRLRKGNRAQRWLWGLLFGLLVLASIVLDPLVWFSP